MKGQAPSTTAMPWSRQIGHRRHAHRAAPGPAVHPHAADSGFEAVANDLVGRRRRSHQQRATDGRPHVLESPGTRHSVHRVEQRVYRHHVVAAAPQLPEE